MNREFRGPDGWTCRDLRRRTPPERPKKGVVRPDPVGMLRDSTGRHPRIRHTSRNPPGRRRPYSACRLVRTPAGRIAPGERIARGRPPDLLVGSRTFGADRPAGDDIIPGRRGCTSRDPEPRRNASEPDPQIHGGAEAFAFRTPDSGVVSFEFEGGALIEPVVHS